MPGSLRRGFRHSAFALTLFVAVAPARAADEPLTLERLYGMPPLTKLLPGYTWVGDSKGISHTKKVPGEGDAMRSAFVIREVPSGKEKVLRYLDEVPVPEDLAAAGKKEFAVGSHTWNTAGTQAAFVFGGDVFLVDRGGQVERCTDTDGEEKDPVFSRDGSWLAYSRGNDLFTYHVADHREVRHTTTGCDTVYNGVLNWVYMEDLFTRGNVRAYWWSPVADRLAFLEIRDGVVPPYPIVDQVDVPATWKMQRYPKPGDPNPVARVGLVDAAGGAITWVDADTRDDSYIARVNWLGDGTAVAVEKLNRAQDHLSLLFADAASGRTEVVMEEKSPAWVNITDAKHFYQQRRQFLWGSERDGHMHLHLFNLDGTPIAQVTRGEWEVTDLDGVDEKKKRIYFTANEGSVLEQHLYRIDEKGGGMKRLTAAEGTHTITMSPDYRWYIDSHTSQTQPTRVTVHNADGKELFELGNAATDAFAALRLPAAEYFTIASEGRTYHCRIMKPLDFDPAKKYPVIVYTYGGPHAQVVAKAWSRHDYFHAYMAQRGYLVFSLDNRGSSGRGRAWEEAISKRLGENELDDQVAGVNYLKSLPYVDGERIGIWGWSYGGYMTLMALFNAPDAFRAGAAVAPVSDWRLYDSIYTERYMKLPEDNAEGYEASAPITHADRLEGGLLVLHGDADDNVHVQNSVALARKLIDAGKDFDLVLFPQKEHSIHGTADRLLLYRKMAAFFDRELKAAPAAPALTP
jgi:dipeptidyl-peptidase-4